MRMLVVDDNPAFRRVLRHFLEDLAQVHECEDGADALAAYEKQRPDWVLMDISMPGVDGLIAMRQILAAHPEARIAILTQADSAILRAAAAREGARRYFLKDDLTELLTFLGSPLASR